MRPENVNAILFWGPLFGNLEWKPCSDVWKFVVCVCVCVFFLWGGCCGKGLLPILSLFSVSKQVLRCYKKTKLFVKASGYRKNVLQYSNLGNVGSEPTLLDVVLLRCSSDTDAAMQSFWRLFNPGRPVFAQFCTTSISAVVWRQKRAWWDGHRSQAPPRSCGADGSRGGFWSVWSRRGWRCVSRE